MDGRAGEMGESAGEQEEDIVLLEETVERGIDATNLGELTSDRKGWKKRGKVR